MAKKKSNTKALPKCALRHWDCFACDDQGRCSLLTDMSVVERQKHCSFYKKRNQAL